MDTISDFLNQIKNALAAGKSSFSTPYSKMKEEIVKILLDAKYIDNYKVIGKVPKKILRIDLKYNEDGSPAIQEIKRISKPGCRRFIKSKDIKSAKSGYGRYIISTPEGLMTNVEAKKRHLGGEIICEIF
ncbi:MAG: 30S ribosomal protein S8 [Candidatus Pacebacteria bacterium]|nr:30S ribosomal protein S8 [Candidatus Paceibacterota bacterium]